METDSRTYFHSYRSQSIYSEIYLKADLVKLMQVKESDPKSMAQRSDR